jgi:preprotein translocase subunit SecG
MKMGALQAVFLVIYIVAVLLMIAVILVQQPKGGGLSGALGGSGVENVLGVRGAPTFFTKLTAIFGGIFIILSLVLSLLHGPGSGIRSVVEDEVNRGVIDNLPPISQESPQ